MKTIHVIADVKIPKVPNYLIIDNFNKLSIADVLDTDLEEIGKQWTKALLERAREIRKIRT